MDESVGVFVVLVDGVAEDSGEDEVGFFFLLSLFEELIVPGKCFDARDAEHGGEGPGVGFAVVVGDDVIHDLFQALGGLEELLAVDILHFYVDFGIASRFLLVPAYVFD